ncbi:Peptide deformylase [Planctomycetes bacterium Pan216]|uniref:Peptide deformylase n=1 Tax=Kolteria novifilia TaxID=2527975 RepID=A0A518BCR8_9BACT|nr:Peptide deformylase [Planctomycetes bacterium Pan216]
MLLEIAQMGQPVLRAVGGEVDVETIRTPEFQAFLDSMIETMHEGHGIGLAAPQVFKSSRIFVANIMPMPTEKSDGGVEVFINPKILGFSEEASGTWEGCLSIEGILVYVTRPLGIQVEYLDRHAEQKSMVIEGYAARVFQHEFDHLDGILTLDRAEDTRDIIIATELDAAQEDRRRRAQASDEEEDA